ncbi:hypothetical protein [Aurantibacillus circumpalustris]|uniref:hypothetical protein n=1 Tax=Aurantibacillus circumpalustris TaxID=3036359 RepID=UPI00295B029E|nr:hypothetical protein [Aurantibacillus circumpalustris]
MQLRTFQQHIPCLIGLIFGLLFFCINITSSDFSKVPGDLGDARFNNYILEHAHLFFTGKISEFWNAPFIYPEKNIIAYSDNLLGSAPFYSLFRLAGKNTQDSFQYWFILMTLLNYLSCYILLFYLFRNPYSAALGALIFAFSIALQSQIVHAQLFPRFAIPLCILAAVVYLKNLNPFYFLLSLIALIYQFYCGMYMGFLLFITLFFFFLISFIYQFKEYIIKAKNVKWWLHMFGSLLLSVLLLLPLIIPYSEKATGSTLYEYWEVVNSLPSTRSFFYSHPGSYLWKFLENTGKNYQAFWDHQIFPGAIAIVSFILFSVLIIKRNLVPNKSTQLEKSPMVTLFLTAICLFIFFIRYQDYSLYRIIFMLPGFDSMRALQRIVNIELLFFGIAFAYLCNVLFTKTKKISFILFFMGLSIFYIDNSIREDAADVYEKKVSSERIKKLNAKLKHLKKGTIFSYEPDTIRGLVIYHQLDAMLCAQENNLKCLNGYTSNSPNIYSYYWLSPNKMTRRIWLTMRGVPESQISIIK